MGDAAEDFLKKFDSLPAPTRERLMKLVDELSRETQRVREAVEEADADFAAGRYLTDEDFTAKLEAEFGPLSD